MSYPMLIHYKDVRRKTWEERMQEKTGKQFVH